MILHLDFYRLLKVKLHNKKKKKSKKSLCLSYQICTKKCKNSFPGTNIKHSFVKQN